VIPLAFVATVPAKMLTWKAVDWQFFGLSFLVAAGFLGHAQYHWSNQIN